MSRPVGHTFDPQDRVTRANSYISKATALSHLYQKGCRNVVLLTCPGAAVREEEKEHTKICAELPDLHLKVLNFENSNLSVLEEFNLEYGCLIDKTEKLLLGGELDQYDGIFLEWDGINALSTDLQGPLWDTYLDIISACLEKGIPIVTSYTHSPRTGRSKFQYTAQQPTMADQCMAPNPPYEAFLLEHFTTELAPAKPYLLWSSRNHWRRLREMQGVLSKKGACLRWVWAFE